VLVNDDKHDLVGDTIRLVIRSRGGISSFAVLGLIWSSLRFFQSLARGVNRAWGTHDYTWWRLPIQNAMMIGLLVSALLVGVVAPAALKAVDLYLSSLEFSVWVRALTVVFHFARLILPSGVLFYGFSMFYKLAPKRKTQFSEVWLGALVVTVLLQLLQMLFVLYVKYIAHLNTVYGAFGSVIAVLMWVYLTGSVIILGACFCAAQADVAGRLEHEVPVEELPGNL